MALLGDTRVQRWIDTRTFHHSAFPPERLAVERDATVSVCLLGTRGAATVEPLLRGLVAAGAIDEVLVVDEGRRALEVATGDVVAIVDGDAPGFGAHVACGVVGPIVCEPGARFCSAFHGLPEDAAGVGELCARPMLRRFWPELAGVHAPLAREFAGRRDLLASLPLAPGRGGGIGVLLDVFAAVGLRGMAQIDVGERHDAPQPLADDVLGAMTARLEADGRLVP